MWSLSLLSPFRHLIPSYLPVGSCSLSLSLSIISCSPYGEIVAWQGLAALLNSISSSFFLSSGPAVSEPASLFLLHPICLHVWAAILCWILRHVRQPTCTASTQRIHTLHDKKPASTHMHTYTCTRSLHHMSYCTEYAILEEGRFLRCPCIIVIRNWESNGLLTTYVPNSSWKHTHTLAMPHCAGLRTCTDVSHDFRAYIPVKTSTSGYKVLCVWQDKVCSSHCCRHTKTPTERLVLNPLKSYEWRSNSKVNRPRRKINLENCLNSCRPLLLSLRDHTDGRGRDECLLVLRGQVHSLYNGLQGLISFVSVPTTSIGSFLCLLKALTNCEWKGEHE